MKLLYRDHAYAFRSPGLFLFLRILKDASPGWVELAAIKAHLPGIHPRQLARFIDLLNAAELPLVSYETKTRGRFRLAIDPSAIAFSGEQLSPLETIPSASASFTPPIGTPLAVYQDAAWVIWVVALIHSNLALHEGELSGANGALAHLDKAAGVTLALPCWTASVVQVRRASLLAREGRYREAIFCLRRVDTDVRQGHAHPAAKAQAHLIRSKMCYDQARYDEAERFLGLASTPALCRSPHSLNMHALLTGRNFLAAAEAEAPALLAQTLTALTEAMGYVFLGHGDFCLLDGLCYNFANNLLRGVKRGVIAAEAADTVMQWLAANMLVCRKMGIGEDSVLANLLLIDVGLDHGCSVKEWPQLLRCEVNASGDLEGLLARALAQAKQTGNRLEIAQCLRRHVRLSASPDAAKLAYFEALELFDGQGRKDCVDVMAKDWFDKYGRPPPVRFRVHKR